MDTTTRERAMAVLDEIQADLEADTSRWEGRELTGPNVAAMLGEIRGTIHGLAEVMKRILWEELQ